MEKKPPAILIILTLIAFAFPLYTQVVWLLISGSNSHEATQQMFLRHFPSDLKLKTIHYLTIGLSLLTLILAELWRRRDTHLGKTIAFLIVIASSVIAIITLFQIV